MKLKLALEQPRRSSTLRGNEGRTNRKAAKHQRQTARVSPAFSEGRENRKIGCILELRLFVPCFHWIKSIETRATEVHVVSCEVIHALDPELHRICACPVVQIFGLCNAESAW